MQNDSRRVTRMWTQAITFALIAASVSPATAQLLPNGSFEYGDFSLAAQGVEPLNSSPRATAMQGWTVGLGDSGAGIFWVDDNNPLGFHSSAGSRFLNLVGSTEGADGAGITLFNAVSVTAGHVYQLSFDLGISSALDHNSLPGISVVVTGTDGGSGFFLGNTTLPDTIDGQAYNNHWESESLLFTATSDHATINFSSLYSGMGTLGYPEHFVGLDNVRLTEAPEPTAASLLLPVLGVVFLTKISLRGVNSHKARASHLDLDR